MSPLPVRLTTPVTHDGKVAARLMQDLTVYLVGPTEDELDRLIALYESICPPKRLRKYITEEITRWPEIQKPLLTQSGRAAAAAGKKWPHFEPVRQHIQNGRGFGMGLWDGVEIDSGDAMWSFQCRRLHLRDKGLFAFARILVPLDVDPAVLKDAALRMAETIELHSGHGGLTFGYQPWLKGFAFDGIYALARRFWGVDVEDLNVTLPLSHDGLKSIGWLTLIGKGFEAALGQGTWASLKSIPGVGVDAKAHATVISAGAAPVVGDQNRPSQELDACVAVAKVLEPILLPAVPDFAGAFTEHGNTTGWLRRFIDPSGWR